MNYFSQFKGLPKQVYLLGILRLFVGIGSMCFSFASLVMTSILGLSSEAASLVVMAQGFFNALGATVGGRMADTWGRRRTYLLFAGLAFLLFVICGLSCHSLWMIPFLILASFSSNACGPSISALVADFADEEHRVECFSFLYLCVNLGFAIGPSIGGMLFYDHLSLTYMLQGFVLFVVGVILFFCVKETYDPSSAVRKTADSVGPSRGSGLKMLLKCHYLLIFIGLLCFVTICYAMTNFMLPLQMNDYFGLEVSAKYAGRIWTVNGLVIVVFTPMLVSFVKRNHHYINSIIACVLYAVGFGMYAFVKESWLFFAAAVIWSIGEILISTGAGSFIASQSPPSHVGRFQSYYEIARYIGRAIAPPLCALVMGYAGYSGTWILNVLICVLSAAIFTVSYFSGRKTGRIRA